MTARTTEAINMGFDVEMPIIDGSTSTYPYTNAVYNRCFITEHSTHNILNHTAKVM